MNTPSVPAPQGYAIELYFDSEMEKKIFDFRDSIYHLGLDPVLGKLGDKPHVSLAVFPETNTAHLQQISAAFSKMIHPFPVQLDSIGVFPTTKNVLYLTPIPSLQLLQVHRQFHKLLEDEQIASNPYYLPDYWMPHCTIELNLSDSQLNLALSLCKQHFTPIRGMFASLGLISFRPIVYINEYPLSTQDVYD